MAKFQHFQFECFVERVVDSDTLIAWVEVHPDARLRWKIRLQGIEGGELGTAEGEAGKLAVVDVLVAMRQERMFFESSPSKLDQFGRHVGDVVFESNQRLTDLLKAGKTHWRRNRDGKQYPKLPQIVFWLLTIQHLASICCDS